MAGSETFQKIQELIKQGDVKVSDYGLQEVQADALTVREVVTGSISGIVIEDYPTYGKGPCVLVLQQTADGRALHALWGLHLGTNRPAVLITAYIPDPARWESDMMTRRK